MSNANKIIRDTKILADSVKDTLSANFLASVKNKTFSLSDDELSMLVRVMHASVDEGYQRALASYQKSVELALKSSTTQKSDKKK